MLPRKLNIQKWAWPGLLRLSALWILFFSEHGPKIGQNAGSMMVFGERWIQCMDVKLLGTNTAENRGLSNQLSAKFVHYKCE